MKTHIIAARRFAVCCLCAAAWPLPYACAESGGATGNPVTFERLRERFDAALKTSETNENARKYADVRNDIFNYAVRQVNAIGRLGDRAALPFLEEKSLSANLPSDMRACAAQAYVKIAALDESVGFMRKLYEDASMQSQFYFINMTFREKVKLEKKVLTPKTRKEISLFFLEIVQTDKSPMEVYDTDLFLLDFIPEYANSKQRATLNRYANTGNEWVTNTFNPVKAHFDQIPLSKRVDLRDRFPGLPPLPEDKADGKPLTVALAVAATLVAACAAILVALKRRRTGNHANGQPNLR